MIVRSPERLELKEPFVSAEPDASI